MVDSIIKEYSFPTDYRCKRAWSLFRKYGRSSQLGKSCLEAHIRSLLRVLIICS